MPCEENENLKFLLLGLAEKSNYIVKEAEDLSKNIDSLNLSEIGTPLVKPLFSRMIKSRVGVSLQELATLLNHAKNLFSNIRNQSIILVESGTQEIKDFKEKLEQMDSMNQELEKLRGCLVKLANYLEEIPERLSLLPDKLVSKSTKIEIIDEIPGQSKKLRNMVKWLNEANEYMILLRNIK